MTAVTVTGIERASGSVWVLVGLTDDGDLVRFGADWRPARDIAAALDDGDDVAVLVDGWQILSVG